MSIPTYPKITQREVEVLATRKVSTMVPAAPCEPAKLTRRTPVWHLASTVVVPGVGTTTGVGREVGAGAVGALPAGVGELETLGVGEV